MKKPLIKRFEHGFKKLFFTLTSAFLKKGRDNFTTIDSEGIKRVLFIRPEKLGDMVISLPVFYHLKKKYPHLELYTICSPRNIAIIDNDERLEGNFLYTKNLGRDLKMMKGVRQIKADVVVDMVCDDSVTALFLTQLSSPNAWRIGVGKNLHRKYYDFNYTYRGDGEAHVLENTLKLLTAFGIETDNLDGHVPPTIPAQFGESAEKYLNSLNGTGPGAIIGLNISAGQPTRIWQMEKNRELITILLDQYPDCNIIISSDPKERSLAVELADYFKKRVNPISANLNLLEVSAIIKHLKLLITPDTSLVHIARSFKVPVVGLYTQFGKNFKLWKPYNQEGGAVVSGNIYNIHDIEVSDVIEMVNQLLPVNS